MDWGEYSVFAQAVTFANIIGIQLVKPRVTSRQLHRVSQANPDETDSEYFKRNIWVPYLDAILTQIQDKFSKSSETALLLSFLLTCQKLKMDDFKRVFTLYG